MDLFEWSYVQKVFSVYNDSNVYHCHVLQCEVERLNLKFDRLTIYGDYQLRCEVFNGN